MMYMIPGCVLGVLRSASHGDSPPDHSGAVTTRKRVVAFIIDHQVVHQILRHLRRAQPESERGPSEDGALKAVS